jgi:hypothetical protein
MPALTDVSDNKPAAKWTVRQFAEQFRGEMIPLNNSISYFCASVPMSEEDLREYLQEPVAALPPSLSKLLPKLNILLVPYLTRPNGKQTAKTKTSAAEYVSIEKPPESQTSASAQLIIGTEHGTETILAFATKDREMADYHYRFYHLLATLAAAHGNEDLDSRYSRLLREELNAEVHGEVDETSWRLKQVLRRSKSSASTKAFREYSRQSFIDTLTLYLHGICCDIDVETGPRQLPSRYLRKRLVLLREVFPPPESYAVFPEELEPEA